VSDGGGHVRGRQLGGHQALRTMCDVPVGTGTEHQHEDEGAVHVDRAVGELAVDHAEEQVKGVPTQEQAGGHVGEAPQPGRLLGLCRLASGLDRMDRRGLVHPDGEQVDADDAQGEGGQETGGIVAFHLVGDDERGDERRGTDHRQGDAHPAGDGDVELRGIGGHVDLSLTWGRKWTMN